MKNRMLALAIYLSLVSIVKAQDKPFRIVGYFVNWYNTKAYARTFDYSQVTHLNYAFVNICSAGGDLDQPGSDLDTLVSRAHGKNVKVLASLGGGSQTTNTKRWYNDIMLTSEGRAAFSHKIALFINRYKLDGFDIDLEGDMIKNGYYDSFIKTLSDTLKPKGKLLTAALNGGGDDNLNDATLTYFDWINIMSYDFTGAWTPDSPGQHASYEHAILGVTSWSARGAKKDQLCVGVPFYAHAFLTDIGMDYKNYNEILPIYPNAYQQDTVGHMIYYNGIPTIKRKTNMAIERAAGIMIWALQYDVTGDKSLLKAINETVKSYKKDNTAPIVNILSPTKDTIISENNIKIKVGSTDLENNFLQYNIYINGVLTTSGTNIDDTYSIKNLSAGTNTIKVESVDQQYKAGEKTLVVTVNNQVARSPYNNTPANIPGIIEAENYDNGGANITFYDATNDNSGLKYRPEAIDIEDCLDVTKGFDVGWTASGEWLEYTINVKEKGSYDLEFRSASPNNNKTIGISIDGVDATKEVSLPNTGSWQTWQSTLIKNINIDKGNHILRIKITTGGYNLNYLKFAATTTPIQEVNRPQAALYPNPAKETIHLSGNMQDHAGIARYEIININGKKVVEKRLQEAPTFVSNENILVSSIPSGMYILRITNNDGTTFAHSFIKE